MTLQQNDKPLWGLGEVLRLAWPASLSMLNVGIMRFVDGWMVSRVGPEPLSAQLAGGMTAFVYESFVLGTLSAVNTYVAQNYGAKRHDLCGQYARSGLALGLLLSSFGLPLLVFARPLFALIGHAPDLQVLEAMYFRYMIAGMFITQSAVGLERFFYGVHRPVVVIVASVVANAFNVLCNWVLIFGKFGFPAMGLEGAAIGTVAGAGLQLLILGGVFVSPPFHRLFATRRWQASWGQCRDIIRVGWPAGVQFVNDMISWGLLTTVLIGRFFGEDALAAHTATIRYISLSFMPAVGIGIATTSLVGKYIGEGRKDLAAHRTHAGLLLAMAYMGVCGVLMLLFRDELIGFFIEADPVRTAEIIQMGGYILICAAFFQLFDAVGIVYVGALRGAGDTRWPMIVTALLSWGVIIGMGTAIVLLLPQLGPVGPWIAGSLFVILLGVAMTWRFESRAWERIDLLHRPEQPQPSLVSAVAEPFSATAAELPVEALDDPPNNGFPTAPHTYGPPSAGFQISPAPPPEDGQG